MLNFKKLDSDVKENYEENYEEKHDCDKFIDEVECLNRKIQMFECGFVMSIILLCPILKYFGFY